LSGRVNTLLQTGPKQPKKNTRANIIGVSAISFFPLVQAKKAIKSGQKAVIIFWARIYKKLASCRCHNVQAKSEKAKKRKKAKNYRDYYF
jgi:hypothetical protein